MSLSKYTDSRDNNFNLIRFIAASLVLYTHSYVLTTGLEETQPLKSSLGITWGNIAVDVFFITSGFLVTRSIFVNKNLLYFIVSRILRIYPALIVSTIFCILVGLFFTKHTSLSYISAKEVYSYLLHNVTLFFGVHYDLPGVFEDNPYRNAVNGSLWTLPFEVKMYVYLVIINVLIILIEKHMKIGVIRLTFLCVSLVSFVLNTINYFYCIFPKMPIHLFMMFFIGSTFYIFRDKIILSSYVFYNIILLMFYFVNKDLFILVLWLFLPYFTLYVAYVPNGVIRKFNSLGDYSYGIYIYAFPIQQSIIAINPDISVYGMIFISFFTTLLLSYLSWHAIEKNALKLKNYVR